MDNAVRVMHLINGLDIGGLTSVIRSWVTHADHNQIEVTSCVSLAESAEGRALLESAGITVHYVNYRWAWDPRTVLALTSIVRNERVEVIHAHHPRSAGIGAIVGAWTGASLVISWHAFWDVRQGLRQVLDWVNRLMEQRATHLLFNSQSTLGAMIERFPSLDRSRCRVLYNPVEDWFANPAYVAELRSVARAQWGVDDEEVCLGYVANLFPVRRHDVLLRAFAACHAQRPKMRLVLVGYGPERETLLRLSERLGVRERVIWTGLVPEAAKLLPGLDIYINPTIGEGFGMATAEAMTADLAIVAANAPCLPELITDGETGLLVDPLDQEALVRAILTLVDDPARRSALGKAARRDALSRFSGEKSAAELACIYRESASLVMLRQTVPNNRRRYKS